MSGNPTLKTYLAEAMALTGDLDNALQVIGEAIAQVERPGWEGGGGGGGGGGGFEGAERNFVSSLEWARRQQAKMWELRTSTSLARLWQSQRKRRDAYELLARSTPGSPKVSTPGICKRQKLCSPS